VKRLIVTADDVGLHAGITAGALAAHDCGFVTAVSVAANGVAFAAAVPSLRERPTLDIGVHLVVTEERPLSPPGEIASLLGSDERFLPGFRAFALRYFAGRVRERELELEWRRQIERVLAAGLRPLHLNSHQHLHALPRLFPIAMRLAEAHGIPYVRIPADPAAGRGILPRHCEIAALNFFGRRARASLPAGAPSLAVRRTVGVLDAGRLSLARLEHAFADVDQAGVSELVCHPGLDQAALARAYPWRYSWEEETATLCDPRAREMQGAAGLAPTSFSAERNQAAA
jgi:chitin disaccharide deacetylase